MFSDQPVQTRPKSFLAGLLSVAGVAVLGYEPALWLQETWAKSSFDSAGGHFTAIVVGLFAWSATSPVVEEAPPVDLRTHLAAAVAFRCLGQLLVVPVLGALALVVVVYALARVLHLGRRRRAVSPRWLAVLFGLTLPVEYFAKRLFGYGLQKLATDASCRLLHIFYTDLQCAAVELTLLGERVFVDSPCSGARTLVLFFILFAALAALLQPSRRRAAAGAGLAVLAAFCVNCLRIALLAAGLAHRPWLGVDVMAQPWHMAVGLGCLPLGCAVLGLWARGVSRSRDETDAPDARRSVPRPVVGVVAATAFLGASVAASVAPHAPVDVAAPAPRIELPDRLAGELKQPRELRPVQRRQFEQFGGGAARADYGPQTLLVVETPAPLRHLHAPDEWLGDIGYTVERTGRLGGPLPGESYRATAHDRRTLRIQVTFLSSCGRVATSVPEAVWQWLANPQSTWRAIYRIRPATTPPIQFAAFDRHLAGVLELPARPLEGARPLDARRSPSSSFDSTRTQRRTQ